MDKAQLDQLMAALDEMSGMMEKIREMLPGDAADEQSDNIDQATAPEVDQGTDDSQVRSADDKQMRKSASIAMLKKSI